MGYTDDGGALGGAIRRGNALQAGSPRVRFRMIALKVFIAINFAATKCS